MSAWMIPSVVIVALLVLGVGGAFTRILSPATGFYLFLGGTLLAALTMLVTAGAAAFASATGRAWRGAAVRAALIPLLATLGILIPRMGDNSPIMNDVSTDLENPPAFTPDVAAAPGSSAQDFRELQRAAYPDIESLIVDQPAASTFDSALRIAGTMPDWTITSSNSATGRIEATAESGLFRFVDDIVIRIRPEGSGSRLDLRSRSRVGRGDMGANAARIRAFIRRFSEAAS